MLAVKAFVFIKVFFCFALAQSIPLGCTKLTVFPGSGPMEAFQCLTKLNLQQRLADIMFEIDRRHCLCRGGQWSKTPLWCSVGPNNTCDKLQCLRRKSNSEIELYGTVAYYGCPAVLTAFQDFARVSVMQLKEGVLGRNDCLFTACTDVNLKTCFESDIQRTCSDNNVSYSYWRDPDQLAVIGTNYTYSMNITTFSKMKEDISGMLYVHPDDILVFMTNQSKMYIAAPTGIDENTPLTKKDIERTLMANETFVGLYVTRPSDVPPAPPVQRPACIANENKEQVNLTVINDPVCNYLLSQKEPGMAEELSILDCQCRNGTNVVDQCLVKEEFSFFDSFICLWKNTINHIRAQQQYLTSSVCPEADLLLTRTNDAKAVESFRAKCYGMICAGPDTYLRADAYAAITNTQLVNLCDGFVYEPLLIMGGHASHVQLSVADAIQNSWPLSRQSQLVKDLSLLLNIRRDFVTVFVVSTVGKIIRCGVSTSAVPADYSKQMITDLNAIATKIKENAALLQSYSIQDVRAIMK